MNMTITDFKIALRGLDGDDWCDAMDEIANEKRRQYLFEETLSKEESEQKIIAAVCAKVPHIASKETLERGRANLDY